MLFFTTKNRVFFYRHKVGVVERVIEVDLLLGGDLVLHRVARQKLQHESLSRPRLDQVDSAETALSDLFPDCVDPLPHADASLAAEGGDHVEKKGATDGGHLLFVAIGSFKARVTCFAFC